MAAPNPPDRRDRTIRTFVAGLLAAVVPAAVNAYNAATTTAGWSWKTVGASVGMAALTALVTFVMSTVKPAA